MTHSFAAHFARFSYSNQLGMLTSIEAAVARQSGWESEYAFEAVSATE
jgi:hypothetical protein